MRKRIAIGLMSLGLIVSVSINSMADDLFIYPTRNQSAEQQDKDKWECRSWATKQTGFDPAARVTASSPPPTRQAPKGGLVRGAAGVRQSARSAARSQAMPGRARRSARPAVD